MSQDQILNRFDIAVKSISFDSNQLYVLRNSSIPLQLNINPVIDISDDLMWSSSDTGIVRVNSNGTIYGEALGTAIISVGYGSLTATCSVQVIATENVLSPDGDTLTVGDTCVIKWALRNARKVDVILYNDSGYLSVSHIAHNINNSGSYAWTVHASQYDIYTIRVQDTDYPSRYIQSKNPFAIVPQVATLLNLTYTDQSVLSSFSSSEPDIYYVFTACKGKRYLFYSTGSTDTYAYLYNNSFSDIKYDDDNGDDSNFRIRWTAPDNGVYYLKVSCYGNYGTYAMHYSYDDGISVISPTSNVFSGSVCPVRWTSPSDISKVNVSLYKNNNFYDDLEYNIDNTGLYNWTVNCNPGSGYQIKIHDYADYTNFAYGPTFNIEVVSSNITITNTPTTQNAAFTESDNIDYYKFIAEEGKYYVFYSKSNVYIYATILDSAMNQVTQAFGSNFRLLWTAPKTGLYYIKLTSYSVGNYALTYNEILPIIVTSPVTGDTLSPTQSYDIQWTAPAEVSQVHIALYQNGYYSEQIAYWVPNTGVYTWTNPVPAGDGYTIRIQDSSDYTFMGVSGIFSIKHSGTVYDINVTSTDQVTSGSIGQEGEADYYCFTAQAGRTYVFYTTGYCYTYGAILDNAYNAIISNDIYNGVNFRLTWTAPANGTYYCMARGYSTNTTGDYFLHYYSY